MAYGLDMVAGSEDGVDAWRFADWSPDGWIVESNEEVAWEQGSMDEEAMVGPCCVGWEEGAASAVLQVCIGVMFALRIGTHDAPNAVALGLIRPRC